MCGRFTLTDADGARLRFDIRGADMPPAIERADGTADAARYNIAPTQDVLTIRHEGGERRAEMMRWGLVPSWADSPKAGARMINARAETLAERPSFRAAFRRRRCLLPADGFYEWRREGKSRVPIRFALASGEPFAFAGLWERWEREGEPPLLSCAIVTTSANALIAPIHDRMPVILAPDAERVWLDPDIADADALSGLLTPYPPELMRAREASRAVNSPANEGPECLTPVSRLF